LQDCGVRDHTNLRAWQAAREVALASSRLARSHWRPWLAAGYQQLLHASLSVQLNIAEGYALRAPGRTRFHWLTAYGSCVETVECLEFLLALEGAPAEDLESLIVRSREAQGMLLGLLRKARRDQ